MTSATDAAWYTGGNSDAALQGLAGVAGSIGLNTTHMGQIDPQLLKFIQEEIDAQTALQGGPASSVQVTGAGGTLDGFQVQNVQSVGDFMKYVGYAEQFAQLNGWKYLPPARYLAALTDPRWTHGLPVTQDQANQYFFSLMPQNVQQSTPGAQFGMSSTDYNALVFQYTQMMQNLTGVAYIDPTQLKNAIAQHISADQLRQQLSQDAAFKDAHPWLKYGMDYAAWQNYQFTENKDMSTAWNSLTGDNNIDPGLLQQAIDGHWSQQDLLTHIQMDPGMLAKFSWLDPKSPDYNPNYAQHQQQVAQRTTDTTNAWDTLTGTRNIDPGILAQAVKEGWTSQRMLQYIQETPALLGQYAYLDQKYGMTSYADFQSRKEQMKSEIITRFGEQAVGQDALYLQAIDNPLRAIHASGASGGTAPKAAPNTGQSEVR